ncbi:DUF4062 domain-containing protein [Shouchella miscanthi]|uniref:DUF4062 domain-containing protein n=1 Tax=Shouchella miscanthi TaxID=2598861 RepID=UPI0011A4B883|nr:DUF4062 domain-containing protein [Shouchella miscanthi]
MKLVKLIKIFIASPSDVLEQRNEVERLILDWNNEHSDTNNIVLMPIRWENNSTASYAVNSSGQAIINEQIVRSSDILIAIFGNKIGTRTANNKSGTIEEINVFYEKHQRGIGIFFIDNPIPEELIDERRLVSKYREHLSNNERGLYGTYDTRKIRHFITKEVRRLVDAADLEVEVKNNSVKNNLSEIDIFCEIEFDKDEQLFLIFVVEDEIRMFGARWMADETVLAIQKWEDKNNLENYLSERYEAALSKIVQREIIDIEEFTDHGNARLYSMSPTVYKKLKKIIFDNQQAVSSIKSMFPKQSTTPMSKQDLPF